MLTRLDKFFSTYEPDDLDPFEFLKEIKDTLHDVLDTENKALVSMTETSNEDV